MSQYIATKPHRVAQAIWVALCINAGVWAQVLDNLHRTA